MGRRILPQNPSPKKAKMVSVPSIGVIGKSALEIGMISGGPFLSRPLWFTADLVPIIPRVLQTESCMFGPCASLQCALNATVVAASSSNEKASKLPKGRDSR